MLSSDLSGLSTSSESFCPPASQTQSTLPTIKCGPKFHYPCGKEEAMELWEQMDNNDKIYFESYYDTDNFDFLHNGVTIICRTHNAHAEKPLLRDRFWISRRNPQEKKDRIVYDEKVSEVSLDDLLSNLEEKFHSFKPKNFCTLRVIRFEGGCSVNGCGRDDCCFIDIAIKQDRDLGAETICYSLLTCEHPIDGKEKAPSKSLIFFQKNLPAEVFDSFVGEKKLIGGKRWWWSLKGI